MYAILNYLFQFMNHQWRRYQEEQEEAYSNFINSINSEVTRKEYELKFSYFMEFCEKPRHQDMLLIAENELEGKIRDYIVDLLRN